MNEAPSRLPVSAYIMALISVGFVFLGAAFALSVAAVMVLGSLEMPRWSTMLVAPVILIMATALALLSGWQTLQQARLKALLKFASTELPTTCVGCGETFSTQASHCPVCGRKTAAADATA